MKVLIVTPSISRSGGGVSESVRLMSQVLVERGDIEVQVLTLRDAGFEQDKDLWGHVKVNAFRYLGPKNFGFSPGLFWYLVRMRGDIAHVHGLWMFHCFAVLAWALLRSRPYVVTPHGMLEAWIRQRSRGLKRAVSLIYQDYFLKRAAAIHVLTAKESRDVSEVLQHKNCVIVPNFVPLVEKVDELPDWWQMDYSGRTVFLFFGRIHEKKGWRELLSAWEATCERRVGFANNAVLVFCGWVDGQSDFSEAVFQVNSRCGNVIFAGAQFGEQKVRSFAAASFLILPSKSEGLPMVVLEAWSMGVPSVMTDACNLQSGFSCGAAIEIGESSQEIESGLLEAWELSDGERLKMAAAGRALIVDKFSGDFVSESMCALYRQELFKV